MPSMLPSFFHSMDRGKLVRLRSRGGGDVFLRLRGGGGRCVQEAMSMSNIVEEAVVVSACNQEVNYQHRIRV